MVRSFDPSGRDLVFVPVGLNYDRVLEDRSLLRELDPGSTKPGAAHTALATLAFVGKNLALLARNRWRRFGYACVNLGAPISLGSWLRERGLDPRTLPPDERKARVADLASELMGAIARVVPVLPVPLVATVFAREPGRGFTELELKADVLRLAGELAECGAKLHVPRHDLDYAITVGLRMLVLRHVVVEADGLLRAAPDERLLLDYYAGSVAHLLPPLAEARSAAASAHAAPAA
jgi:glycerol-3-phosphate O-acyltransferase